MRTSEIRRLIKNTPAELELLKQLGESGKVIELKNGRVWREHSVKKGVDHYKVYDPTSSKLKVITRGVSK